MDLLIVHLTSISILIYLKQTSFSFSGSWTALKLYVDFMAVSTTRPNEKTLELFQLTSHFPTCNGTR